MADLLAKAMQHVLDDLEGDSVEARSAGILGVLSGFSTLALVVSEQAPKSASEAFQRLMHEVPEDTCCFEAIDRLMSNWDYTNDVVKGL